MLETAFAQLRFALSLGFGRPVHTPSLDRLVDAIRETQHEFGPTAVDAQAAESISGPKLDDATRRDRQLRRFRGQARTATRETGYYQRLFAELNLDPGRLSEADIAELPLTSKDALRGDADAFVRRGTKSVLRAMTTGTTGWPTSVYFSTYELKVIVALSAIAFLLDRHICEEDIVQLNTSSRATLGNIGLAGACAQIGALAYLTGVVDPAHALALLAQRHHVPGKKERASLVSLYPSYLGELVETGSRLGYRPADFGLERILVGGEVVTEGLKERARRLFGPVTFVQGYAMTETIPFGGTGCSEGHLHVEPSHGLLEVIDPENRPAISRRETGHARSYAVCAVPRDDNVAALQHRGHALPARDATDVRLAEPTGGDQRFAG